MEAVREATRPDLVPLRALLEAGRAELAERRGGELVEAPAWARDEGLAGLLGRHDARVLVGTIDGVVVAGAVCRTVEDLPGGRRGVFDACYVDPGARGIGLGRLLLDDALDWFRHAGCRGVEGHALPGDREAKAFFESGGFTARLLTMYRPLG